MSQNKPSVFPTKEKIAEVQSEKEKLAAYNKQKAEVTNEIYTDSSSSEELNNNHKTAVEMMRERTMNQLQMKEVSGKVVDDSLAEVSDKAYNDNINAQKKLRDEQLAMNKIQTEKYHTQSESILNAPKEKRINVDDIKPNNNNNSFNNNNNMNPPTNVVIEDNSDDNNKRLVLELSQPNYNAPFDVIPLPSAGKTYTSKKENVRLSYMTTADENILTSPNLLASGEFLSILINRKVLEPELRYDKLLVGDRNAIMIWLRATGYGEKYPVTLFDENDEPFDTIIDLNELKTKPLGAEPDENGLFDFHFKLTNAQAKFRLLNCGDIDAIEKLVEQDKENNALVNNESIYRLERMIVSVNGYSDKNFITDFINSIRIPDSKKFNEYVDKIEPGIDLNIEVGTPGGGSVKTFLPLNISFFWPDFRV